MAKSMKFSGAALSPWTDLSLMLNNMRSLKLVVDGKEVDGDFTLELDDSNHATLTAGKEKVAAPAPKPSKKAAE